MKKCKSIQMPISFVSNVLSLLGHLDGRMPCHDAYLLCCELQSQIDEKLNAMHRRDAFSKYTISPVGSIEREKFRKQYLDIALINKKWRSDSEDLSI